MIDNPSQETLALLGKTNIFRDLNPEQLKEILSSAHRFKSKRHSFLFHQGEPANSFYVLLEGNARLTQITPEGRQVIMHYFGPGDVMAVIVVLANAEYPASAETTTDCIILSWDREVAIRLMEQYPPLAIKGMEMVAGRFWELQNRYLHGEGQGLHDELGEVFNLKSFLAGNTGPVKGRRIDPYAVSAGTHHHCRIIGDDVIQVLARGLPSLLPLMVVPAAADNPFSRPV